MNLQQLIETGKNILKEANDFLDGIPDEELEKPDSDEIKLRQKREKIPPERLAKFERDMEKYKPCMTEGQISQALLIWEYDPCSAVRYCRMIDNYKCKVINKKAKKKNYGAANYR